MEEINLKNIYRISENVVAREIEDEFIIIPIKSGIGDSEDDMYSLNETGLAIWGLVDGKNSVEQIISFLNDDYEARGEEIKEDVMGIMNELLKRSILEKL